MISDIRRELIFWDVVYACKVEQDPAEVVQACYQMMDGDPGINVSNRGGWHSKIVEISSTPGSFQSLEENILSFCNTLIEDAGLKIGVKSLYWWVNVNGPGSYNNPHNHPKTDLSVVYYPKVPVGSGNLVLARTDSATYGNLYNNLALGREFEITPAEGYAYAFPAHLWHWVQPNLSQEDRISVTFNVECG